MSIFELGSTVHVLASKSSAAPKSRNFRDDGDVRLGRLARPGNASYRGMARSFGSVSRPPPCQIRFHLTQPCVPRFSKTELCLPHRSLHVCSQATGCVCLFACRCYEGAEAGFWFGCGWWGLHFIGITFGQVFLVLSWVRWWWKMGSLNEPPWAA